LPLELATRLIFIGLKEHRDAYDLETMISHLYRACSPVFLWLDQTTRGQAETVYLARHLMDPQKGLMIFNIDTAFAAADLKEQLLDHQHDGLLGSFHSNEPRFSYARVGNDGYVDEVREKVAISSHALTGLYHFASTQDFLDVAGKALAQDEREMGEFYVAPLYNHLIARGAKFRIAPCQDHWILGTPAEYQNFLHAPLICQKS
jgi:dTDP-glucose pyrophosphorylase